MSGAVTAIDVVGPKDLTGELARHEVHLVGGLRTAEDPRSPARVAIHRAAQPLGSPVQGLVPGSGAQLAVLANHRLGQPGHRRRHRVGVSFLRMSGCAYRTTALGRIENGATSRR